MITFEIKTARLIQWRNVTGRWHKLYGPAVTGWYDNGQKDWEEHRVNGELHRTGGPAYTGWYSNGQKHCEGHWVNGELHHVGGPAYAGWPMDKRVVKPIG